ncbi:SIMPL domain-containing protein [Streptomyces monticola]|uniref:SIMPL domain-containing protein n=1 Tax=Streptomyces monticola TaxID=2666263 RepID=A0ABW2JCS1_9ACTN
MPEQAVPLTTTGAPAVARALRPLAVAVLAGGLLTAAAVPAVAAPAAGTVSAGASAPAPAVAPEPATVTVTGEGSASAAPDMAVITAGVEVRRPSPQEALTAQNAAADRLLAAVRKQGVADRDVRTENLSLSAVTEQPPNATAKVTEYQAGQVFSIRVRDIKKTGPVIQKLMDAAGDAGRIHSVAFDVAKPGKLRAEARRAAHEDARDKAEQHARLSGRKLGRLLSLNEGDSGRPRPVAMPAVAFDKEGVPVAPGEVEDNITVTAEFEMK